MSGFFTETPEGVILNVRAQPRSSRSGLDGLLGDAVKVRIRCAPVDGKANKELVETLADAFDLPKSAVVFKSGETSKTKRILLRGLTASAVRSVCRHIAIFSAILFWNLFGTLAARASSAENGLVIVSCDAPRAQVANNGNHFDVFAPGYLDSFVTNVMVTAKDNWTLVEPTALPLKMKGGDIATYKVVRPPECSDHGTIAFHNYYIASDRDGGLKDVVVEAGASVTYTAHKNGSLCASDWTVNGEVETDTSRIVFNRRWWDVPSWFIPLMDTPKPGVYNINAHDVRHAALKDSGSMTVVGVKKRDQTGASYADPAWKDDDLDGVSDLTDANADASKPYQPVAYLSTKRLLAEGMFLPSCTKVSNPGEYISVFDTEAAVQKLRFAPNNRLLGWDWSTPVADFMA